MVEDIEEMEKYLADIGTILKSQYRGIDQVIDDIIKRIQSWYMFDELLYKPTIICLWGMTGQGKTTLIRDLVKLLEMYEKYVEINVSKSPNDEFGRTSYRGYNAGPVSSRIYNIIRDSNDKGIVLIDEAQKLVDNLGYNEIWSLLSDGRLGTGHISLNKIDSMTQMLNTYIEEYTDNVVEAEYLKLTAGDTSQQSALSHSWNPLLQPIPLGRKYIIDSFLNCIDIENFDQLTPLFDFQDFSNIKANIPFGYRNYLKNMYDNDKITIRDIFNIPGFIYIKPLLEIAKRYRETLVEEYSQVTSKDPTVLSKLLIFIAGNVDGLYTDCANTEIDADELHKKTLKLSVDDLKKELLKNFKPEEVSRFGGNHVIYPSLNREAFTNIITDKLKQIEKDVLEISGIRIVLNTPKYVDHIYNTSVVASQGARPVIGRIYSEVNSVVPRLIKHAKLEGLNSISISYLKEFSKQTEE